MSKTCFCVLGLMVAVLASPGTANAQDRPAYRFDLGVNGGFAWYTDMLDDDHLGEDAEDVKFESGWITGLQATWWVAPRIGIRANGTYSERPVVLGSYDELSGNEDNNLLEDINLWTVTGDVLLRPLVDGHLMGGVRSMPYLALGIGAKNINPAGDMILNPGAPEAEHETGAWFQTPDQGMGPGEYFLVSETKLAGLAALGTDVRLSDNFGLRLELGDRFWDATLRDPAEFATNPDEDLGKVVHELYATVGAHALLGLASRPVVAVSPAPPRPARPEAQPQPQPVEERIRVCVIDPAAANGVRMIDAIHLPQVGDTLVVVNGVRRPLSATAPEVMLASDADWFVRGEPLKLTLEDDYVLEYTTWRSGVVIAAEDLAYLGTVRGLPVYVGENDAQDVHEEIEELRRARASDDLDDILEQREDLHEDIEEIQYLYVPLRPTGCVFQTIQLVPQVRKQALD